MSRPTTTGRPGVLILVQNLPVPFDRRVWQEAGALRDAGYDVSVICPSSEQFPAAHQDLDGIHVHRYRPRIEARGLWGYLLEYGVALTAMTVLAWRVSGRRRIDVVQACNPPDLLFVPALPLVLLRRARFLFDHHDVSPELLMAKGHDAGSRVVRVAKFLERLTFGCAVATIATNESYRQVAITRGGMSPEDVFVVRSGPAKGFDPVSPNPGLKRGRQHLVGYVGVMGAQEGIDLLLDTARLIVDKRQDVTFALAGSGPEAKRLRARSDAMGLAEHVHFLGRVSDADLVALLTTADVCVNPDEVNPMNDISTMNKVVEYMALGRPIAQFDTREGRVSAGNASLYATPNDPASMAEAICRLLDDPELRAEMGALGMKRFREELSWSQQVPALIAAYERALGKSRFDVGVRQGAVVAEGVGSVTEQSSPRVVLVGPPLAASGGIGRVMSYALAALAADGVHPRVLDTRGRRTSPWFSVVPLLRSCGTLLGLGVRQQVDVVHVNISSHGSALRKGVVVRVCRLARLPVVLHLHASSFPEFFTPLPDRVQRWVRRTFGMAARVVVLGAVWSSYVQDVLGVEPDRITVLPNATPGAAPAVGRQRGEDLHVLFLGRLGTRKGLPELLGALTDPRLSGRAWRATLAGDGEVDAYRARVAELGVAERITFPGWVGPEAVARLLSEAHVLVLPSHAEGLPMSVLEAFAVGVPVVCTPVGGLPEAVVDGGNGLLVPPGDVAALADALLRLLEDEPLRLRLASGALNSWVRDFSIDRYAARLLAEWHRAAGIAPQATAFSAVRG